jgi:hypothetical protein
MNLLSMKPYGDLSRDVSRVRAMDAAWDEAAAALGKFDLAGFDRAMDKFNSLSRERRSGSPSDAR